MSMFQLTYEEENYKYQVKSEFLNFVETLLKAKKSFKIELKSSSEEIIKDLQELCRGLNIQLIIDSASQPEAVAEVIKVLGSTAIGATQGGVAGFFIGSFLEVLKEKFGAEKALEQFLEPILGVDVFIPGVGQVMLAAALVNALISGVVSALTLRKVGVTIHFSPNSQSYGGLVFEFNGNPKTI